MRRIVFRDMFDTQHIESRYWNGNSSAYGTGDQLLGLLERRWEVVTIAKITRHRRGRIFTVYSLELSRSRELTTMIIVNNPFVERLMNAYLTSENWHAQPLTYSVYKSDYKRRGDTALLEAVKPEHAESQVTIAFRSQATA